MFNETFWQRVLYVLTGMIAAVAIFLASAVMPSNIEKSAITVTLVFVIIHLLIVALLIWIIKTKKSGGHRRRDLLVATGVISILFSLIILDGAFAFIHEPGRRGLATWMFLCSGLDFIAGLMALFARFAGKV